MSRIFCLLALLLSTAVGWTQTATRIVVGAERMDEYLPTLLEGKIAVVGNHSSLVGQTHLVDTLVARGVQVQTIFCPEHGFRGTAEAGARVDNSIDPSTGIAIVSLYGKNKKPTRQQIEGLRCVVFDLQDVGCRFYTYISTLHYVMETCAEVGVPLMVLDRPNPNGHYVDGPVMEKEYCSFVGMRPGTPIVYGMTIGEYARMIDSELSSRQEVYALTVIPLLNYTHDSIYRLPVPPSPALRTPQAVALYPSLCLFEGTSISVGRGTDYPFEVIGNDYKMDLREVEVPARLDLRYLLEMYQHSGGDGFFLKNNFFEKLAGTADLRRQMLIGATEEAIRASWEPQLSQFKEYRKQFLLYPEH